MPDLREMIQALTPEVPLPLIDTRTTGNGIDAAGNVWVYQPPEVERFQAGGGAPFLPLDGSVPMTGPLILANATPVAPLEAASKQYVDGTIARAGGPFLPLTGGQLSGPLDMNVAPIFARGGIQATTTPIGTPNSEVFVYQQGPVVSATTQRNIWSAVDLVTGSAPGTNVAFNVFQVSGDNSTTAGSVLMELSYFFGGANFTGQSAALNIGMNMNAASNPPPGTFYMGANIFTTATASCGGTDTVNGSKGEFYGLNVAPELDAGAINISELTSCEIDSMVKAGASVSRRVNLKLVLQSAHAVQGTVQDALLEFGRIPGSTVASRAGLVVSGLEGIFPLDNTTGVVIDHEYSTFATPGINPQVDRYIDASHIRTNTAHWLSPGAILDSSGYWNIGPSRWSWAQGGATLNVSGQVGGTPIITAGGVNAFTGQLVTTGNGDLYTVTASGGAITALTVVTPASSRTTGPTNAQIIQGDGISGGTCVIPWTDAHQLTLQPGGGPATFGGSLAAADLSLTDATAPLLFFYGEGVGPPAFTTRSLGTKIALLPTLSASAVDYAIGIASSQLWQSIPQNITSNVFAWYGGTTEVASLDGTGNLAVSGSVTANTSLRVGGSAAYTIVTIDHATGVGANILEGTVAGSNRWQIHIGDNDAEGAGNTGSSFAIYRFDNTGGFIDNPLSITRNDGMLRVYGPGGLFVAHGAGFFGTAPLGAKPTVTGSHTDGTAIASLLTALASYGLVTNNTTP